MRIAFHAPLKPPGHPTPSGDRRMARLLIAALAAAGHRVELASRFRSYDGTGDPARQEKLRNLGQRLAARLIRRYEKLPPAERPDAWFTYHLYHRAPDWLGPTVSQALGIPYLLAEASFAPKQADGPWAIGHAAVAAALPRADAVFGLNAADGACILPLLKSSETLIPLPPFLDIGPYSAAAAERKRHRRDLAKAYGIVDSVPWILAVAMMRPGDKLASYTVLGQSLERLLDRPWRLIVAGDGPARNAVAEVLSPIAGRTLYLGALDGSKLPSVYAACDLCAWPAVNEAYGMALLEAQATGLPVVAADVGGVGGVVADGESGLLAATPEPSEFAGAVASLLDDPGRRTAFGRNAIERVETHHSIEAAAECLGGVIAGLGERNPRS